MKTSTAHMSDLISCFIFWQVAVLVDIGRFNMYVTFTSSAGRKDFQNNDRPKFRLNHEFER